MGEQGGNEFDLGIGGIDLKQGGWFKVILPKCTFTLTLTECYLRLRRRRRKTLDWYNLWDTHRITAIPFPSDVLYSTTVSMPSILNAYGWRRTPLALLFLLHCFSLRWVLVKHADITGIAEQNVLQISKFATRFWKCIAYIFIVYEVGSKIKQQNTLSYKFCKTFHKFQHLHLILEVHSIFLSHLWWQQNKTRI